MKTAEQWKEGNECKPFPQDALASLEIELQKLK